GIELAPEDLEPSQVRHGVAQLRRRRRPERGVARTAGAAGGPEIRAVGAGRAARVASAREVGQRSRRVDGAGAIDSRDDAGNSGLPVLTREPDPVPTRYTMRLPGVNAASRRCGKRPAISPAPRRPVATAHAQLFLPNTRPPGEETLMMSSSG